jgi:hypothetical protein
MSETTQNPAPAALPAVQVPTPAVPVAMPTFGPQWPGPGRTGSPRAILAALVTGLVAAGFLGWDRPGLGWFVTGLVGAVAVTVVALVDRAPDQPRVYSGATVWRGGWALLGLALLSAGALRASGWLWLLCLPTAVLCGAFALAGGRRLRALVVGVLAVPIAMVRALPWAARGLAVARGRTTSSAVRILAALIVSLVLLLVFGALLAGADAVFASVVDRIVPTVDGGVVARWIWSFGLLFFGTLAACFLAIRPPAFDSLGETTAATGVPKARRTLGRLEWGVPVGTLVVLFGGFVAVGAAASFGGDDYVQRTAGLTYAEYARQGFWQLLAVTLLTLLVLAVAARVARRETTSDRLWIRILLGLLALLTLLIVASALHRMSLYEQTYGFTVLRLLVGVCEGWLGLVFALILLAGVRLQASWLPRVAVAAGVLALVGLVAVNPDGLIAEQNVSRYQSLHRIDLNYLETLSADAVPALNELPADLRTCVLAQIDEELDRLGRDEPRQWNLSRSRARQLLADYVAPTDWYVTCGPVYARVR